jgi:hypothetical protein
MTLVPYDEELIERVAWRLAEADGFRYGRCGTFDLFVNQVRDIIVALEVANEEREKSDDPARLTTLR